MTLLFFLLLCGAGALEQTYKKPQGLERQARFWGWAAPALARYAGLVAVKETDEARWTLAHEYGAAQFRNCVDDLGGFFVKTGQIVALRRDLFPEQYCVALTGLADMVDPLPFEEVQDIVAEETGLHHFASIDPEPLGAASIAQVHRAVLQNGKEVALKVQRRGCQDTLLGDVKQLKDLAALVRSYTPVDYYIVFSELERQLADEFDFVQEAASMDRVRSLLGSSSPSMVIPRVIAPLSSKTVLTMDYLKGQPLSRLIGQEANLSRKTKAAGILLLDALTDALGKCIFETGFFHGDVHPGNVLVLDDGRFGLIDFGQVKQISGKNRATLGKIMQRLASRSKNATSAGRIDELDELVGLGLELGVVLDDDAAPQGPAAVAIWLWDRADSVLPDGYDQNEMSPKSPANALVSFPQDLVLIARSSVLIKGIAASLNVTWPLADKWAPIAKKALGQDDYYRLFVQNDHEIHHTTETFSSSPSSKRKRWRLFLKRKSPMPALRRFARSARVLASTYYQGSSLRRR